jgi:hypothetical protein
MGRWSCDRRSRPEEPHALGHGRGSRGPFGFPSSGSPPTRCGRAGMRSKDSRECFLRPRPRIATQRARSKPSAVTVAGRGASPQMPKWMAGVAVPAHPPFGLRCWWARVVDDSSTTSDAQYSRRLSIWDPSTLLLAQPARRALPQRLCESRQPLLQVAVEGLPVRADGSSGGRAGHGCAAAHTRVKSRSGGWCSSPAEFAVLSPERGTTCGRRSRTD